MGNLERVVFVFTLMCFSKPTVQMRYKAAVVEYAPKREFHHLPRNILAENTKEYVKMIEEAAKQEADIIIFPENGLTTSEVNNKVLDHLESYGVEFPSSEIKTIPTNPCFDTDSSHRFHKVLVDLSCAAKGGNIFVVINLAEKETIDEEEDIFNIYSTNFVFDRNGTIVKKYRKIHFHNDLSFKSGTQGFVTVTTDFGVTFGLLIGADILYRKPATELLKNLQVTDVIYTTSWSPEMPFLSGLSIQHGYAKANRINLLTASLNDPLYNSTGSGIFLANGSIADEFISTSKATKLLIQEVPINGRRLNDVNCEMYDKTPNQLQSEKMQPTEGLFKAVVENMENYTFEPLDFRNEKGIRNCSEVNNFCCFDVAIDPTSNSHSNYIYKIASFAGARRFGSGSRGKTLGVMVCALVACLNENSTSCGMTKASAPNLRFSSISLTVNVTHLPKNNYLQPTTLKYGLFPVTDYVYCVQDNQYFVNTTNSQSSLLSFGIFGRIYDNDNEIAGSRSYNPKTLKRQMNPDNKHSESGLEASTIAIIIISATAVAVFCLVLCLVYLIRKKTGSNQAPQANQEESVDADVVAGTKLIDSNAASSSSPCCKSSNFVHNETLKKMAEKTARIPLNIPDKSLPYIELSQIHHSAR